MRESGYYFLQNKEYGKWVIGYYDDEILYGMSNFMNIDLYQ